MGFNALPRKTSVPIQSSIMNHASVGSSLASHSQVADVGNHSLEGCVRVNHSVVARRGMFIVDRVSCDY